MGLEFVTVPDRDGSCVVKLEMKHNSSGGIPLELKISLAELLRRNAMTQSMVTVSAFDVAMQRLQGFQRVSTNISLPGTTGAEIANDNGDDNHAKERILRAILAHAALVPVVVESAAISPWTKYWSNNNNGSDGGTATTTMSSQLRLVASLPASGDPVFVLVTTTTTPSSTSVQLTVCCDNALAVNSLVDVLKRAIVLPPLPKT